MLTQGEICSSSYLIQTLITRNWYFVIRWQKWQKLIEKSSSPTISYNNLDYGDYTFTATVKSLSGEVLSDSIVYQFSYPAPFYLSIWAWFGYAFLLYVCVYGYTRWHTNKIVRRNQKVAEAKLMVQKMKVLEQERIIAEQQKILLENELE